MFKFIVKKFIIPILASLLVFVLFDNDAFFYKTPVGQITQVQNSKASTVTDSLGNLDQQITQKLTIRLLNGENAGQSIHMSDNAVKSQLSSQIYQIGQKVLLSKSSYGYQISSFKRDAAVAGLAALLIGLTFSFVQWRFSVYLLLSILLNLIYFLVALALDVHLGLSTLLIFSLLALVFAASSLLFVLGRTWQFLYTFLSTVFSTVLTFLLSFALLTLTNSSGIYFEYLDYITQDPVSLFYVGAIISVLGAIMDGCSDIVAGLIALQRQNPDTRTRQYFKSGLQIGREITGTLTNVLFMIFMAEYLPMTLLLLRNDNSWSNILQVAFNLGLLQTLISAIGIILSVPITAGLTTFMLDRKTKAVMK